MVENSLKKQNQRIKKPSVVVISWTQPQRLERPLTRSSGVHLRKKLLLSLMKNLQKSPKDPEKLYQHMRKEFSIRRNSSWHWNGARWLKV